MATPDRTSNPRSDRKDGYRNLHGLRIAGVGQHKVETLGHDPSDIAQPNRGEADSRQGVAAAGLSDSIARHRDQTWSLHSPRTMTSAVRFDRAVLEASAIIVATASVGDALSINTPLGWIRKKINARSGPRNNEQTAESV